MPPARSPGPDRHSSDDDAELWSRMKSTRPTAGALRAPKTSPPAARLRRTSSSLQTPGPKPIVPKGLASKSPTAVVESSDDDSLLQRLKERQSKEANVSSVAAKSVGNANNVYAKPAYSRVGRTTWDSFPARRVHRTDTGLTSRADRKPREAATESDDDAWANARLTAKRGMPKLLERVASQKGSADDNKSMELSKPQRLEQRHQQTSDAVTDVSPPHARSHVPGITANRPASPSPQQSSRGHVMPAGHAAASYANSMATQATLPMPTIVEGRIRAGEVKPSVPDLQQQPPTSDRTRVNHDRAEAVFERRRPQEANIQREPGPGTQQLDSIGEDQHQGSNTNESLSEAECTDHGSSIKEARAKVREILQKDAEAAAVAASQALEVSKQKLPQLPAPVTAEEPSLKVPHQPNALPADVAAAVRTAALAIAADLRTEISGLKASSCSANELLMTSMKKMEAAAAASALATAGRFESIEVRLAALEERTAHQQPKSPHQNAESHRQEAGQTAPDTAAMGTGNSGLPRAAWPEDAGEKCGGSCRLRISTAHGSQGALQLRLLPPGGRLRLALKIPGDGLKLMTDDDEGGFGCEGRCPGPTVNELCRERTKLREQLMTAGSRLHASISCIHQQR